MQLFSINVSYTEYFNLSEMDDYLETIQRLTFNDGSTQACTGIQIINDQTLEDLEDFRIRLETAVERVNLAPAEGSVVIVDDDGTLIESNTLLLSA